MFSRYISFFSPLIALLAIHIFLCKRKNKYWGLLIPFNYTLNFLYTVFRIFKGSDFDLTLNGMIGRFFLHFVSIRVGFIIILILTYQGIRKKMELSQENQSNFRSSSENSSKKSSNFSKTYSKNTSTSSSKSLGSILGKTVFAFMFIFLLLIFVLFNFAYILEVAIPVALGIGFLIFFFLLFNEIKNSLGVNPWLYLLIAIVAFWASSLASSFAFFITYLVFIMKTAVAIATYYREISGTSSSYNKDTYNNDSYSNTQTSSNKSNFSFKFYEEYKLDFYGIYEKLGDFSSTKDSYNNFVEEVKNLAVVDDENIPSPVFICKNYETDTLFIGATKELPNNKTWNHNFFHRYTLSYKNINILYINYLKGDNISLDYAKDVLEERGLSSEFKIREVLTFIQNDFNIHGMIILEEIKI